MIRTTLKYVALSYLVIFRVSHQLMQCKLATFWCPVPHSVAPSEGITSPLCYENNKIGKMYVPSVYPSLSLSLERGKVERGKGAGVLTNVLCLHPLLLLFLFVDIPVPTFSTGLYGRMPHYGEVCHINSSTEDHVGHPNVYSHTYTQVHRNTHTSQTRWQET